MKIELNKTELLELIRLKFREEMDSLIFLNKDGEDITIEKVIAISKNHFNEIIINLIPRGKDVPIVDILTNLELKDLDEKEILSKIDSLKRNGEIFEPKEGYLEKI